MTKNNHKSDAQNGNAFLFILIGIVLFAALSFTVARGLRTQTASSISEKDASLAAAEILDYAQRIQRAVDRVRRRGCSENEISFENEVVAGYENANAPNDNSCHIFHPNGGSVSYVIPKNEWLNITDANNATNSSFTDLFGAWYIPRNNCVHDIGTGDSNCFSEPASVADLTLFLPWLRAEICNEIAQAVNIIDGNGNARTIGLSMIILGAPRFNGNFGTPPRGNVGLSGVETACIRHIGPGNPGDGHFFYSVLLPR